MKLSYHKIFLKEDLSVKFLVKILMTAKKNKTNFKMSIILYLLLFNKWMMILIIRKVNIK